MSMDLLVLSNANTPQRKQNRHWTLRAMEKEGAASTRYAAGASPHLFCRRRSTVLNTNPSTTYPIAMIRIITAMTWLISFKSRPIISNCPKPRLTKIISPDMSDRQAKAHPCFNPETIKGKLAGSSTYQNRANPLAPRFRPAIL